VQVGLGVRVIGTPRIMTQGNLQVTDRPLDITIEGDGFFQVMMPNGEIAYTRAGNWNLDGEGQVVNPDGLLIEPAILVPEDAMEIIISPEGLVSVKIDGQADPEEIGQIELVRFINPGGLRAMGKNLFTETAASGAPIVGNPGDEGLGQVHQGILEMSNVQVVDEMVGLIIAQRAYEANSKGVQTADDLLRIANGLKR
jgi:flagellar basal-body rod protein FlgG